MERGVTKKEDENLKELKSTSTTAVKTTAQDILRGAVKRIRMDNRVRGMEQAGKSLIADDVQKVGHHS